MPRTISNAKLVMLIPGLQKFTSDSTYALPEKEWVLKKFVKFYKRKVFGWGVFKWRKNWDCDNFAALFASLASVSHAKTRKSSAEGLAIGEFWFIQDNGVGHAVNCIVSEGNKLWFLEPQTGKEITLSQKEFASCFFCRF